MKHLKQVIALVLAVVLCAGSPENAFASSAAQSEWSIQDGVILSYGGKVEELSIPSELNGQTVTTIAKGAFADNRTLFSVLLPETVDYIEGGAFTNCTGLEEIYIDNLFIEVEANAFANCPALKTVIYTGDESLADFKGELLEGVDPTGNQTLLNATVTTNMTARKNPIKVSAGKKATKTASKTDKQTIKLGVKARFGAAVSYAVNFSQPSGITVSKNGVITIAKNYAGVSRVTITAAATARYTKAQVNFDLVVKPMKTTLSSVTNSSKGKMAVKWAKNTTVADSGGYELQYSKDKTFKTGSKTVTVAKSSTVSKTISGLKKGKTYYVRVRAYIDAGSNAVQSGKIYGAWSSTKSVKIKK